MAKHHSSDDGTSIDGKMVVFLRPRPEYCRKVPEGGDATDKTHADPLIAVTDTWNGHAYSRKDDAVQVIQDTANVAIDAACCDKGGFP
jgi:hypothetical protein